MRPAPNFVPHRPVQQSPHFFSSNLLDFLGFVGAHERHHLAMNFADFIQLSVTPSVLPSSLGLEQKQ